METLRKIIAAIVGILIIIAIILLAKWVGDQVREKFLTPKSTVTVQQTQPTENPTVEATSSSTATYSAIPQTGPKEESYALFAFLAIAGLASIKLAHSLS